MAAMIVLKCDYCEKQGWFEDWYARRKAKRSKHHFCSTECSGLFARELTEAEIAKAIDLRLAGETWTYVQRALRASMQGIQCRIWYMLAERGMLHHAVVMAIWSPPIAKWRNRQPSWAWLEKKTGILLNNA